MLQRSWASMIILAFLYCNVAVIIGPVARRYPHFPSLPLPAVLADAFLIFGVFSYYEHVNRELVIEGLSENTHKGGRSPTWIRIDVTAYFPFHRGEKLTRVWADRHIGNLTWTHREAQRFLANKIRTRHNRDHPESRVSTIRIYGLTWPRSKAAYFAEFQPGKIQRTLWYAE